jgi:hypothetical protein
MAKKPTKKRVQSKTEQKLRGQLKYQRAVRNKETKALSKDMQENFFRIATKTKGSTTKKSTDYWERNKKIMQKNAEIEKIEEKLKRFKYKKREPKKIQVDEETTFLEALKLGHAWQVSKFNQKLKFTKFYEGVPIAKSKQKMQRDLINEVLRMGDSVDILYAIFDSFDNLLYFEIRG